MESVILYRSQTIRQSNCRQFIAEIKRFLADSMQFALGVEVKAFNVEAFVKRFVCNTGKIFAVDFLPV